MQKEKLIDLKEKIEELKQTQSIDVLIKCFYCSTDYNEKVALLNAIETLTGQEMMELRIELEEFDLNFGNAIGR